MLRTFKKYSHLVTLSLQNNPAASAVAFTSLNFSRRLIFEKHCSYLGQFNYFDLLCLYLVSVGTIGQDLIFVIGKNFLWNVGTEKVIKEKCTVSTVHFIHGRQQKIGVLQLNSIRQRKTRYQSKVSCCSARDWE